jgi:hypothetical protein
VFCEFKDGSSDDFFMDMDQSILVGKKSIMIEMIWAKEARGTKLGFWHVWSWHLVMLQELVLGEFHR